MSNFTLQRPLAFIDVETTGLNPKIDRIIELTILKILPNGTEELRRKRINPKMPIPSESYAVHGISDKDVEDEPIFRDYARSLLEFLDSCDLAGFGIVRFDVPFLEAEFRRCGMEFSRKDRYIVDALTIFHQLEPRDLAAAYRKYCGKEMESAHSSHADVKAALEVLEGQLKAHPELPREIGQLHSLCNPGEDQRIDSEGKFIWCDDKAVINFGRYQGKPLIEVANIDPDYLRWIASADFPEDTKRVAICALKGEYQNFVNS